MRRLSGILSAQRATLGGLGDGDPSSVIRSELERVARLKAKNPKAAARMGGYLERVSVALDPGISDTVDALMTAAYPAVARVLDEEMAPVIEAAHKWWPVKSGYSRARLVAGLSMSSNNKRIRLTFASLAAYTLYIKWAKQAQVPRDVATSSHVWVSLGRTPWALAAARAKLRIPAEIAVELKNV